MKKIRIKRTASGWSYGSIAIKRRKWSLPVRSVSYIAVIGGVNVETDTLAEMRDYLATVAR